MGLFDELGAKGTRGDCSGVSFMEVDEEVSRGRCFELTKLEVPIGFEGGFFNWGISFEDSDCLTEFGTGSLIFYEICDGVTFYGHGGEGNLDGNRNKLTLIGDDCD